MTLTQLRTFLAVADSGSIRGAAEHLVVTQSAVSASLGALQRSLGVDLVRPEGRGLRLTASGEVYAAYVRGVLGLLDQGRVAARGESDPEQGELRVAAVTTAGEHIVPRLLAGFRERYPRAGVLLEVGNRERVWGLLDSHEVDLVIAGRPGAAHDLAVRAVRPNELIVVASATTRMPEESVLPWLARQTWLLREHGSGTRATTEAYLDGLDLAPRTLTLGSNGAVRESVVAGLGVTLISRDAVARELAEGTLVELPAPQTPLRRHWCLVSHRGRLPATAALLGRHVLETGTFRAPKPETADAVHAVGASPTPRKSAS